MKSKVYSIIFLILINSHSLSGQDYALSLENAFKQLSSGKFSECAQATSLITENKNTPVQYKWQAYKLGAMSYIALGDEKQARKSALKFLQLNPTYKANPTVDSREFRNILQSLMVIPKFSLGIAATAGANLTFPTILNSYAVSGYSKKYSSAGGYQLGIVIGYSLTESWTVNLGCLNTGKSFIVKYNIAPWQYKVTEKLQYLETPISLRYALLRSGRIQPFAEVGGFYGRLLSSYNHFQKNSPDYAEQQESVHLSSISRRNKSNYGYMVGAGVNYKVNSGHFNLLISYFKGLSNITKSNTRYLYTPLMQQYEFADDEIKLSNLLVSLGYTYYINFKVKTKK